MSRHHWRLHQAKRVQDGLVQPADYQHGTPLYVELRMLEKKKLLVLYRNLDETIMTAVLTHAGREQLAASPY